MGGWWGLRKHVHPRDTVRSLNKVATFKAPGILRYAPKIRGGGAIKLFNAYYSPYSSYYNSSVSFTSCKYFSYSPPEYVVCT